MNDEILLVQNESGKFEKYEPYAEIVCNTEAEFEKINEAMRQYQGWIDINDRLPDPEEYVLVSFEIVKYKYYPENSKEYGTVIFRRTSRERDIENMAAGYGSSYAAHALKRIEEYCQKNYFPEKDIVAWC